MAQAQDRINRNGGIDGTFLKVLIVDEGQEDAASAIASRLGNDQEVLGVVEHYHSGSTKNAAQIYEENGLAIISLSSSVAFTTLDNRYVFRTSPSDAITGEALAEHMIGVWQKSRVAVFFDPNSTYSDSLANEFVDTVTSKGGEVVAEFDWSTSNFNLKKAFNEAMRKDVQVLMVIPSDGSERQNKVLKIAELNVDKPFRLMGGDVMYSTDVLNKSFEGAVVGAFWHIDAVDETSDFVEQSQELWNAEVNWETAMAYDATQAWIQALEDLVAQGSIPTRVGLQEILASSTFSASGASEDISFDLNGDRIDAPDQLVTVRLCGESYCFEPVSSGSK